MDVTGADLHDEEAVQTPQRHGAVRLEEVDRQHGRCLGAQELPPRRVGLAFRGRSSLRDVRIRRIVDAPTRWPSLSSSPWIRWYPHVVFSVASRAMRVAIFVLAGGRPARCG